MNIEDDVIYKVALTFSREELAGMYTLCNLREQKLKQENEKLKEVLKIAMGAIDFYGDIDNWHCLTTESIKYVKIDLSDFGDGKFYKDDIDDSDIGGKRARQAKKKIDELLKELEK